MRIRFNTFTLWCWLQDEVIRRSRHACRAVPTFADLRIEYHRILCAEVLGYRENSTILNIADSSNRPSRAIAQRTAELIDEPLCPTVLKGQTAGNEFTRITMEYLQKAFRHLQHVRPGEWLFGMNPSEASIALFNQYSHLGELDAFLAEHPELKTAIGADYLVTPDIVVGRVALDDDELNVNEELVELADPVARRSPLRELNDGLPMLHASISCKYTMRSDRSQNTRTEALNLIRNRKGPNPHIVAVTFEPLPSRISSIAMGTGDVDCTYHAALDELLQATIDLGYEDAEELLRMLIDGHRLRDISDLPLDLAT